jgi:hypothetical protein
VCNPLVLLGFTDLVTVSIILAETMQKIGIRAFVGKLSMDISTRPTYTESTPLESLASARTFIDRIRALTADLPDHARLIEPVLTPRFVPTCSDALLRGLGDLAEQTGVKVQSHLAEARDQMKVVQASRGMSDLEVFERVSSFLECPLSLTSTLAGTTPDSANDPSPLHLPHTRGVFTSRSAWHGYCTLSSLECIFLWTPACPARGFGSRRTCWIGY